jgi:Uma2 family endonuclease
MSDPLRHSRMTSDEFIAWAMEQPEGKRYELAGGEVVGMAAERSRHALTKFHIARRMAEAVEAACLPCIVYPDGMAVVIDDDTTYEPDAMIRCGEPLDDEAVTVFDPIVVVEVVSPSSSSIDVGEKFMDYFRLPSLRHYLIVRTRTRSVIHHARDEAGTITTRIIGDGTVHLDPPGITVRGLFSR